MLMSQNIHITTREAEIKCAEAGINLPTVLPTRDG
uniref:Uncharacterized protein n=1 Tax=Anguilla anguilla TaxID=7936 RepID=A0A0E9RZQ0_ANGAN